MKDLVVVIELLSKNANRAKSFLTATETALNQVQEYIQRTQELVINVVDESGKADINSVSILVEVESLYDQMLHILNTTFSNKILLAGYKTDGNAFDHDGNYLGDKGTIEVEIEQGRLVSINLTGDGVMHGEGLERGINIFDIFQRLMLGFHEGEDDLIVSTLSDFMIANDQISLFKAQIGACMLQIDRSLNANEEFNINLKEAAANIEEADPIKVFAEMACEQIVLNAIMSAAQKILSDIPKDLLFK